MGLSSFFYWLGTTGRPIIINTENKPQMEYFLAHEKKKKKKPNLLIIYKKFNTVFEAK